MQAAQHSIHLQYFIWGADLFTDGLKQILIEKARAGVEVRLLYDPIGSQAHVGHRYIRDMQAEGIKMEPTSPSYHLHTISYRNHRKITVIDGAIGYTGGMNIGQEQLDGGEGFDSWRYPGPDCGRKRGDSTSGIHGGLVHAVGTRFNDMKQMQRHRMSAGQLHCDAKSLERIGIDGRQDSLNWHG